MFLYSGAKRVGWRYSREVFLVVSAGDGCLQVTWARSGRVSEFRAPFIYLQLNCNLESNLYLYLAVNVDIYPSSGEFTSSKGKGPGNTRLA